MTIGTTFAWRPPRQFEALKRATGLLRDRLRRVEAELAGSNDLLARHPDPVLLVNRRRRVARINNAACELFGADIVRRDLAAVLQNVDVLNATEAVLNGGAGRIAEFWISMPALRHFRTRIEPLPGHSEDGVAVLLAMTDLTDLKRIEQMRADFVANASHELRTPLSTLLGFIETLQESAADDPETLHRFLPIMQQQATRMARLVDDLLSLSRIEMNEHLPPTAQVALPEILRSVVQALAFRAEARGMRIELNLQADLQPVVGDADQLTQVFQNLIDNAIKYAAADSVILVEAGPSPRLPDGVAVSVRDRGQGIAAWHLPRLTERFYRADTDRSSAAGGTGLGLAIVKHVVNRHRGLLGIESELGRGSVFTVHLCRTMPGDEVSAGSDVL